MLHAHKYILSKKSSVFCAMFRHDTIENRTGRIMIKDISIRAMKEVLRHIYTGNVPFCDENPSDILMAADKYDLNILKEGCESRICDNLKLDNAIELLAVADQCQAPKLKTKAMKLIIDNADVIVEKPEFDTFANLHPLIVSDIFRRLAYKVKKLEYLNSQLQTTLDTARDKAKHRLFKRQRCS